MPLAAGIARLAARSNPAGPPSLLARLCGVIGMARTRSRKDPGDGRAPGHVARVFRPAQNVSVAWPRGPRGSLDPGEECGIVGTSSRMAIFKNNPYGGFNFNVVVDGSEPAAFSTVIIPTVEIDVVEYRDGNDRTSQPRQVVGLTKYTNLVLKRGVASSPALWEWFDQVRQGTLDRRDIIVTLLNEERHPWWSGGCGAACRSNTSARR